MAVQLLNELPSGGKRGLRHPVPAETVAAVKANPGQWARVYGYTGASVPKALRVYGETEGLQFVTVYLSTEETETYTNRKGEATTRRPRGLFVAAADAAAPADEDDADLWADIL